MSSSSPSSPTRLLGLTFAPLSLPWARRAQTLAVTTYVVLMLFGGAALGMAASAYLVFYTDRWAWLPFLYFAWYFYDLDTAEQGGRNFT